MSRVAHGNDAAHAADANNVRRITKLPGESAGGDSPASQMARRLTSKEQKIVQNVAARPGSPLGIALGAYVSRLLAERVVVPVKSQFPGRAPTGFKLTIFGREVAAVLSGGAP